MMSKVIPVILAGGSGTRLWPLSRSAYPKQCLPLLKENETLLQSTVLRVTHFPNVLAPIIVCHEDHRFIVAEQLRQINIQPLAIILESTTRNTAPAIALAVNYVKQLYPSVNLLVMPADHIIDNRQQLLETYHRVNNAIEHGQLVAFGVEAKSPETGFGYIKTGQPLVSNQVYRIEKFIEKPSHENAKHFVESDGYYWNCGIFAFNVATFLKELEQYEPLIAECCDRAMIAAESDSDFIRPSERELGRCPTISIDYAVMEKTPNAVMSVLHTKWSDVGSWDALMQEQPKDNHGNVKIGDVITHGVNNSYLRSENGGLLAVTGVSDHVIVATKDAVLVAHRDRCQDVKQLVADLKSQNRDEAVVHLKVHRPWGYYQTIAEDPHFKVKRITVCPNQRLSLQRHHRRSEHWVVISGEAQVINGNNTFSLKANESTFIPAKNKHRLANDSDELLELIEVQVGEYLGEDDIERFSDIYGRVERVSIATQDEP